MAYIIHVGVGICIYGHESSVGCLCGQVSLDVMSHGNELSGRSVFPLAQQTVFGE